MDVKIIFLLRGKIWIEGILEGNDGKNVWI